MYKGLLIIATGLMMQLAFTQDQVLPTDFRQHNLTEYNSSLFSPVFTLDRNNPESVAIWSRWQWQTPDTDPSTLMLNYSRKLNPESGMGIAFFQHNTGTFLQTGGIVNYAYSLVLNPQTSFQFGVNVFAFSRSLANEPFDPNPGINLPLPEEEDQFLLQVAPGIQFTSSDFVLGLVGENLLDYNFGTSSRETSSSQKSYMGYASYNIPVGIGASGSEAVIRPMLYFKNLPGVDDQYGLSTLFSASKFWVQGGYNSFYGISGGIGGRFFKNLSVGALAEFGIDSSIDDQDPSFEIVTAYYFGPGDLRKKVVGFEEEDEDKQVLVAEPLQEEDQEAVEEQPQPTEESIAMQEAREQARRDQLELERKMEADRILREQQVQDSIMAVRAAEIEAAERRKAAELATRAEEAEKEQPQAGERIERTTITKEGVAPGYYLIVNVFGNPNYYRKFMAKLQDEGLNPGSFLRPKNNYNYVYLERYNTLSEALRAKRSQYNGRYKEDIWIFAVSPD